MVRATRSVLAASWVLVSGGMVGCGDSGTSATGSAHAAVSATPVFPISRTSPTTPATAFAPTIGGVAPTISGVPGTTAVAGQPYSFQPNVVNASVGVSFAIQHVPVWAKFDSKTGQLSGTPGTTQVGHYSGISISLVTGATSVALPPFTITVAAAASTNAVTLSWQPPTENADGTPLVDLKGYRVHYGPSPKSYSDTIQVSNPGLTTYVVQNLDSGKYYFAVTAYNSAGQESSLSPEVATQVD